MLWKNIGISDAAREVSKFVVLFLMALIPEAFASGKIPVRDEISPTMPPSIHQAIPSKLRFGLRNLITTPFHFQINISSTFFPASISAKGAVDPQNRETEATAQTYFLGGISASASTITIGNHTWYRTSPPGGGYQEGILPIHIPRSIPWHEILPYLTNIEEISGAGIDGKEASAYRFNISQPGLNFIAREDSSLPIGTIQSAHGTIYLQKSEPYLPIEAILKESVTIDGLQYPLLEIVHYRDWGEPIFLNPPG
ncbi:hypothetical protein MQE22_08740 [Acidithiobacillus sp. YTS05]|nr:hypothetical protein MQE22_08740 [Acidithiobacillus sp. YTS05]